LVDHTIKFLTGEYVVMPLKEDCDPVIHHELMDGLIPCAMCGEIFCIPPFELESVLNAAAPHAKHVMSEDEFIFGIAGFKRLFEPRALRITERDVPQIAILLLVAVGAELIVNSANPCSDLP
jgi:hypothetical protein